jgi:adenylate cyclase
MNPAQLGLLMNDYYATMFEPVSRHEGAVSDVVGDAMLAIWTTSSGDESSLRKKACLACLDIADALERFNAIKGRPPLYTRIGLHSGEMLLGAVGALHHFEYRAVGDIVNTTNRIQGLNKYLGTRILVSEQVIEGLDDFLTRSVGRFLLAGRTTFIRVAELMVRKQEASSEQTWLAEIFTDAMLAYEAQEWNRGCYNFAEILKAFPDDGPARFYLKRCQHYRETPPVGPWDACIRMEGK